MKKGFTLVELVIVIVIVGILSVIAVPIYRNYLENARLTEGMALASAVKQAEEVYYAEHGEYYTAGINGQAEMVMYNEVLGVDARSNKFYKYFYILAQPTGLTVWTRREDAREKFVGIWSPVNGRPRMQTFDSTTGEYKDIR